MDKQDLIKDLVRNDHGDPEINKALERVRILHIQKGLPYVELMRSKFFGNTVRYILKEHNGLFTISNLDNNEDILIV